MSKPTLTVVSDRQPARTFSSYQGKRNRKDSDGPKFTIEDLANFADSIGLELAQVSDYHFRAGSVNIYLPYLKCHVDGRSFRGQGVESILDALKNHEPRIFGNLHRPRDSAACQEVDL